MMMMMMILIAWGQALAWTASSLNPPTSTLHSSNCRNAKRRNSNNNLKLNCNDNGTAVLVSPFFFWGTAMVAVKEVFPLTASFFVASFRLIPAGLLLVAFAGFKGRPPPSGLAAWLSITLFALVDASFFQVIIDSQPLTVALLASLLFGKSIGIVGASGLVLGVIDLLLLEVHTLAFDESNFSLWGSGEWWMLLAAQSMAIATVMVRWVSKYSDPVMATGWDVPPLPFGFVDELKAKGMEIDKQTCMKLFLQRMIIGGLLLLAISVLNHDPAFTLSLKELTASDVSALLYISILGSAITYEVYFYSATKGSLTKLSSLTFLTPMFASIFGFLYLGEAFSPIQLVWAIDTVVAIYIWLIIGTVMSDVLVKMRGCIRCRDRE